MKHLILLLTLVYLSSCVEGEQKVIVSTDEGIKPSFSITQTPTNGSPPALPIPPNLAFTSTYCNPTFCPDNEFPFLRTTSAILEVEISNPSSLPFTLEWSINNGTPLVVDSPTKSGILIEGNNLGLFPLFGFYTIQSAIKDSSGVLISSLAWSVEIVDNSSALPQFSSFTNPQLPSPAPFPAIEFGLGKPDIFLNPNPLSNPSNASFTVFWELDGVIDPSSTFNGGPGKLDPPPFIIDPDKLTPFGFGRHSIVALLYDNSGSTPTLVDSANWNFEMVLPPPALLLDVKPATSTQIYSVIGIPMNATSPSGGFFQGPQSDFSRGTPMVVALPNSSTNTFCLTVSDGRGTGFDDSPANAGILVQYSYANFFPINPLPLQFDQTVSPQSLCLDGKGSMNPSNGVQNFSLGVLGNTFITATITDKLSLQSIGKVTWNITVNEVNTLPTLLIAVPFSTSTMASVKQDTTYNYSFTVSDQDCSPSLSKLNCYDSTFSFVSPSIPYPGITLNGTNTYYGVPDAQVTPNCVRDYSYAGVDKFSCLIRIPSNDGLAPMPATGTYQVNANVNNLSIWDNGSPALVGPPNYFNPIVTSPMLKWNLSIIEINNGGPQLNNPLTSGLATPILDSYAYLPVNPFAVASTATEGDSILFNLVVNDLEKDNYKIKFFHNTASAPATFTEYASPTYSYAIGDKPVNGVHPVSAPLAPFILPFTIVTGSASATITFRVQITDAPDSATPITNTFNFPILVTNVNPIPEVVTGTEEPSLVSTAAVMQGFPYTMRADITDVSTGYGSQFSWQWMINQNAAQCASRTAASWKSIPGADEGGTPLPQPQTASITWSPPSPQISAIPPTTPFCFRNCIGDDDYPGLNSSNCSPTMAGPWVGPIKGSPADIPSDSTGVYLPPNLGDTAVWADPVNVGEVYGVHLRGNTVFLIKYDYNLDTTVIQTNGKFPTREGIPETAAISEAAYDVSMTGNNQFIFVSYVYNNPSFFPPFVSVPTHMVVKILKTNFSSVYYFINDKIPSDVGQIVANNFAFWVPFSNSTVSNTPFYFGGDGSTVAKTTINGSFSLPISVSDIQSKEQGGKLYMAFKLSDGRVNLYTYTLPSSISPPISPIIETDIFFSYYVPFTDMSLSVGPPSNPNVFVAGINGTTKGLFYGVKEIGSLGNIGAPWMIEDFSNSTSTYPQIFDPKGLNAVASYVPGEVLLGFIRNKTSPFSDLYILKSDGTNLNLSKRINQNMIDVTSPREFSSADFALTNIISNFPIGSAGAIPNENIKDTLWFRYWDFLSDRMVIINIEDEKFSGATPTTGNAWSDPWFKQ